MANNYAKNARTVVLMWNEATMDEPHVLQKEGKTLVFPDFKNASRYVANFVEPKYHPYIHYANERPVIGAGDVEDTNGRKCLRCGTQLVLSGVQHVSEVPEMGVLAVDEYDCPKCSAEKKIH